MTPEYNVARQAHWGRTRRREKVRSRLVEQVPSCLSAEASTQLWKSATVSD